MADFTPGPWAVVPCDWDVDVGTSFSMCGVGPVGGEAVAAVVSKGVYWGPDDTLDANAKLIAASPLLLEALQELHLKTVVGTDDERHAALYKAWAAITAATGER